MAARKKSVPLFELPVPTADGEFIAGYSGKGLAAIRFPASRNADSLLSRQSRAKADVRLPAGNISPAIRDWHRAATVALKRALAGRAPRVLPPLDLAAGTPFQQRVWNALLKIPAGQTRSYGELAKSIRNPRGVRAVGRACGANPLPVLVPCHRILAANHHLGGYSGGLKWKKLLLWREGSRDWWVGEKSR